MLADMNKGEVKDSCAVHVFFVHTPYQASFSIDLVFSIKSKSVVFFCEGDSVYDSVCDLVKNNFHDGDFLVDIIKIELIKPADIGFRYYDLMEKNIDVVGRKIDCLRYNDVDIFISDINWPINNSVYFMYRERIGFSLFEDGIGSYLGLHKNIFESSKGVLRRVFYKMRIGPEFNCYIGEKMGGGQPGIKNQYLRRPEFCASDLSAISVPKRLTSKKEVIKDDSFVFLDQPYGTIMGESKYVDFLRLVFEIKKREGFEVFIKSHHFSKDYIVEKLSLIGFVVLNADTPIEDFEIGCNVEFASFNSSALFNLKMIYGDDVACTSYLMSQTMRLSGASKINICKLKELYLKSGINVYESMQ